ncbi:MAG: PEP-CTERM sorting domain-containing protein [Rubrivivax sp.]
MVSSRNPIMRRLRRVALPLLLALGAGPAAAVPLPAYGLDAQAAFNHFAEVRTLNGFGQIDYAIPLNGALTFSASGTPSPSLSAGASMGDSPIALLFGRSVGTLLYTVMVTGSDGPVDVKIDVAGFVSGSASAGASIVAESRWALETTSAFEIASDRVASGLVTGGDYSDSFGRTVEVTLQANREYRVRMFADAQAAASIAGSRADAFAFVDPVFRLADGVDPSAYAFSFSAGIGNEPDIDPQPVSEPGTLAALAIGLAALARRRRMALP